MHVDDVKLLNCAACERDMLGRNQELEAIPTGFVHLPVVAGDVNGRPVCPDCHAILRRQ
jgi:hypothetical protein